MILGVIRPHSVLNPISSMIRVELILFYDLSIKLIGFGELYVVVYNP